MRITQVAGLSLAIAYQTYYPHKDVQSMGVKLAKKRLNKSKTIIKPGSKEFTKLQNTWYDKLRNAGFNDLEWYDTDTGYGQNSDYLKGQSSIRQESYTPHAEFYYRMCENYLTFRKRFETRIDRYLWELYCDGVPYRTMIKSVKKKFRRKKSLYFIFYRLRKLKEQMIIWNKTNINGLLHPKQTEAYVTESDEAIDRLIRNTMGQYSN